MAELGQESSFKLSDYPEGREKIKEGLTFLETEEEKEAYLTGLTFLLFFF